MTTAFPHLRANLALPPEHPNAAVMAAVVDMLAAVLVVARDQPGTTLWALEWAAEIRSILRNDQFVNSFAVERLRNFLRSLGALDLPADAVATLRRAAFLAP